MKTRYDIIIDSKLRTHQSGSVLARSKTDEKGLVLIQFCHLIKKVRIMKPCSLGSDPSGFLLNTWVELNEVRMENVFSTETRLKFILPLNFRSIYNIKVQIKSFEDAELYWSVLELYS